MKRLIVPGVPRARGGGLVLPGDARRGMATLHVPAGYESDPENAPVLVGVCTVPGCEREGTPFYRGQEDEWARHVGWCARKHRDDIAEVVAEHQAGLPAFRDPNAWDPEIRAHMDKVGERMKREGRLTVKRNERAGF